MNDKKRTAAVVAVIVAIIVAVALFAWFNNNDNIGNIVEDNQTNGTQQQQQQDGGEQQSTLSRLVENPSNFAGQTVTVDGEIEDVFSNRVFTISEETIGDEFTVLTRGQLTSQQLEEAEEFLADNANVRVTGTVRKVTIDQVEQDFGLDADPAFESRFDNQFVLVADSITFLDRSDTIWDFEQDVNTSNQNNQQ